MHFLLPISFASIASFSVLQYLSTDCETPENNSNSWSFVPIIFISSFNWSVKLLCDLESSFYRTIPTTPYLPATVVSNESQVSPSNAHDDLEMIKSRRERHIQRIERREREESFYNYAHTIPSDYGRCLSYIGFILPLLICLLSNPIKHNFQVLYFTSNNVNTRSLHIRTVSDFTLSTTLAFLAHSRYLKYGLWWKKIPNVNLKKLKMMEILSFVLVTEILIHQHLISLCTYTAQKIYQSDSEEAPKSHSRFVVSLLLNGGIFLWTGCETWRQQQHSASLNRRVNIYLIASASLSSLCFGIALALPWRSIFYFLATGLILSLYQSRVKVRIVKCF